MSLEWLIIGGGIHGVHVAGRLIAEVGVAPDRVAIVDPADRLLARWRSCTEITGMRYLRSPAVHNLDVDPMSLHRFADEQSRSTLEPFAEPYSRPTLDLFNAHCDQVVSSLGLAGIHRRDRAVSCIVGDESVRVELAHGGWVEARNVILAIGTSERPAWPAWAPQGHPKVQHIFAPGFDAWPTEASERVAVIGGGISAAQVALRLLREGHRVRLVTRHALREHQFDSDPGWLGPKLTRDFFREPRPARRREIITDARHRGSIPPEIRRPLQKAIHLNRIVWDQQGVEEVIASDDIVCIRFASGLIVEADRVLLATGFAPERPGGEMVDALVESASLRCAQCGYPIVDETLRWHQQIFVTGPLAELELGPVSRNIAGARRAGDRIVKAARRQHRTAV